NLAVTERDGEVIFLRRLVPGGANRSYGLHVARLAGVPDHVVDHAQEIMARLASKKEKGEGREERALKVVREISEGLLLPADDGFVWQVIREMYGLDIANLTPVQALVMVNEWQSRLRGRS
ncbi:MAG TPA: DNA mismatch repair protein MutS, partial [Anaerolineae bacterium]|nr:DNA mismatch repair protein MutS [Anaerolineae bacterium]